MYLILLYYFFFNMIQAKEKMQRKVYKCPLENCINKGLIHFLKRSLEGAV